MATQRKWKPQEGEEAWKVKWCVKCATDEYGDHDADRDEYQYRLYRDKRAARECARQVYPCDQHGSVLITHVQFVAFDAEINPHVGYWEEMGEEMDYYEGD